MKGRLLILLIGSLLVPFNIVVSVYELAGGAASPSALLFWAVLLWVNLWSANQLARFWCARHDTSKGPTS